MNIQLLLRRMALAVPLLCLSLFAQASHFRYGSITYQTNGANNRDVTFKVSEAWRDDAFGSPPVLGQVVPITSSGELNFGDGTPTQQISLTVTTVGAGYFYGEYTTTHTYATSGNFTAVHANCCRISTLQNNADGSFYISTVVGAGSANDSPVSTLPPITNLATGQAAATYTVPAGDPNGNTLTYTAITDADVNNVGFSNPAGYSVNSTTGVVTFNTVGAAIGNLYNAAVKVSDGTTSIIVDHLIQIVGRTSAAPVFVYPPTPTNGQVFTVAPGTPVNFNVRASDPDAGDVVTLSGLGLPSGSTFTTTTTGNPAQNAFSWTPTVANIGTTVINFIAQDNSGTQASTSVTIQVRQSTCNPNANTPVANADTFTDLCGPITVTAAQLLANDTNPLGGPLQITNVSAPSSGTLVTNAGGTSFTFTPAPGFTGPVTFTYLVQQAGPVLASPATGHYYEFVASPGICWGAAQTAAAARSYNGMGGYLMTITSAAENAFVTTKDPGNFWIGASDAAAEGDWRWVTGPETGQKFWQSTNTNPTAPNTGGATTPGAYSNWDGGEPNNFQPGGENYAHIYGTSGKWNDLANCGNQNFGLGGYLVEYGGLEPCTQVLYATGTVTINVAPAPVLPVANPDVFAAQCGGPVTITNAQLLANDTDPLSRPLQVGSVTTPSSGTLTPTAGGYVFTPATGFVGAATFTYLLQVAGPVIASPATGHYYEFRNAQGICWDAARTAASASSYFGMQGYLATVTSTVENDFLKGRNAGQYWFGASDAAAEGTWRWVTGPEAGQQFWQGGPSGTTTPGAFSNWSYGQPDNYNNVWRPAGENYGEFYGASGYWNDLPNCDSDGGVNGFIIEYGGLEGCTPVLYAIGTVTVNVGAGVAAPVANPDVFTSNGAPVAIPTAQLLANDTDPLSRPLQVSSVTAPSSGTLTPTATGFTFTPAPGFSGPATFSYTLQLAGPVLASAATGHYYEFVTSPGICWNAAKTAAAARTYNGLQRLPGHHHLGRGKRVPDQQGPRQQPLDWRLRRRLRRRLALGDRPGDRPEVLAEHQHQPQCREHGRGHHARRLQQLGRRRAQQLPARRRELRSPLRHERQVERFGQLRQPELWPRRLPG